MCNYFICCIFDVMFPFISTGRYLRRSSSTMSWKKDLPGSL